MNSKLHVPWTSIIHNFNHYLNKGLLTNIPNIKKFPFLISGPILSFRLLKIIFFAFVLQP